MPDGLWRLKLVSMNNFKFFQIFEINIFYSDLVEQVKWRTEFIPAHQFFYIMLRKSSTHSFQFFLQSILSIFCNFSFFFFQRIFYFTFCLCRYNECEPVFSWFLFITGNNFYLVTAAQLMTYRNQFVIYFGADTFYTDDTMNGKCKIQSS